MEIDVKNPHVISQVGEQRFLSALIFCHFGRKPVNNVGKTFDKDLRKTSVEIIFRKSWENVAETAVENFTTRYTAWDTTFSKRMHSISRTPLYLPEPSVRVFVGPFQSVRGNDSANVPLHLKCCD